MRVGVPKEVKNHEYRVAITPAGVHELVGHGHQVGIESGAGLGSSITDEEYTAAGAKIFDGADEVWAHAELVLKVKEPIEEEYHRLRGDLVLTVSPTPTRRRAHGPMARPCMPLVSCGSSVLALPPPGGPGCLKRSHPSPTSTGAPHVT